MSKRARLVNSTAVDVVTGDPSELFHPGIAKEFIPVPDQVEQGWSVGADDSWSAPVVAPQESPAPTPPKLSPMQFKMCFTSLERINIKALKATDQVIADAYEILDDPRLTTVDMALASNQSMIDYLVAQEVLTAERAAQIKQGLML